jgi:50S ribosomal protein L16 3-hydroxylase
VSRTQLAAPAPAFTWRADFDRRDFLARVWQRKPLLIRQAWTAWRNPLAPDELAGLACEPEVEARLVWRDRKRWRLEHGPLVAQRFASLPQRNWTLLVQAVDHYVPAVTALLDAFRFVPDWRIDDVMVSYAVDGGGVGPHFDQYDVFLVQGLGQRRWQVGPRCDAHTPLLPDEPLRLLPDFEVKHDWLLEAGDILYLPPGYAHHGIGVGAHCMTYSIGFRAPARAELIGYWADAVIDTLSEDDRYSDAGLAPLANSGELDAATLARLQGMVSAALADPAAFALWFGRHATERKYPEQKDLPTRTISAAQLGKRLARGAHLKRHPASRFAFVSVKRGVNLFVDGEVMDCQGAAAQFAERLCGEAGWQIAAADVRAALACELAVVLYNFGALLFDDEC